MQASSELDVLRDAFRSTFQDYAEENGRLAELLIHLEAPLSGADLFEINRQQERVNDAQVRYKEARRRYVRCVLSGFVALDFVSLETSH